MKTLFHLPPRNMEQPPEPCGRAPFYTSILIQNPNRYHAFNPDTVFHYFTPIISAKDGGVFML
jgi:hypothetical protein